MQSNTNRSANAGETGRLEASPQNTSTSTTSQRLNSQIGQVVNRARDILRSNRSSFTRNASTSFQNGATSAYPKRPRLSGASRYGNVLPKDVVKTVVLLENSGSSNEYPLKNDTIMCYAEVDFVTTDDERLVRNKIVGALKTQIPDIAPDDFEFVKVLGKRVSTPVVADGYNWDFKQLKTHVVKANCMSVLTNSKNRNWKTFQTHLKPSLWKGLVLFLQIIGACRL